MKIGVVGCGPGGLASALFLHRAGHHITLFDQFDHPRPLGSGLLIQPSGQRVLDKFGLLGRIRTISAPVTRLHGINVGSGKRALDMEYRHLGGQACAYGIHRASLFDTLFDAVKADGLEIRSSHVLTGVMTGDDAVQPVFENHESGQFDLLVDAGGTHSPLAEGEGKVLPFAALWTTVDMPGDNRPDNNAIIPAALDQRYMASHKMAGIMPIGINPDSGNQGAALFWSIRPEQWPAMQKRGLAAWQAEFCALWPEAEPFVTQITSLDQLTLAVYRHRTGHPVSQPRIFHIGDSWHATSPQLGQGANMALLDAEALAAAIGDASNLPEIAARYRHARSDHVALYQALSYVFTPLYQSTSTILPVLRDSMIHYGARLPVVRAIIAHIVSGNLGRFG